MKPRHLALLALASVLCVNAPAAESAVKLAPVFNGKDLAGFKTEGSTEFWHVENGVLVGENNAALKGNYLWTEKEYGDFVFECEVRWVGDIDSGIEFRTPRIQLQFGTSSSLKKDMTGCFYTGAKGAVYPEAGQAKFEKPYESEKWNHWRLEAHGTTFTAYLNGKQVAQLTDPKFAGPGAIGLQVHPNKKMRVEYRNIRAAAL